LDIVKKLVDKCSKTLSKYICHEKIIEMVCWIQANERMNEKEPCDKRTNYQVVDGLGQDVKQLGD
jgi:hypothetical protein